MVSLNTAIKELNTGIINFEYPEEGACSTEGEIVTYLNRLKEFEKIGLEPDEIIEFFELAISNFFYGDSLDYLSKYIEVTPEIKLYIYNHCKNQKMINVDICAWYEDISDFIDDWGKVGYKKEEALNFLTKNPTEFLILPKEKGIIRFYQMQKRNR